MKIFELIAKIYYIDLNDKSYNNITLLTTTCYDLFTNYDKPIVDKLINYNLTSFIDLLLPEFVEKYDNIEQAIMCFLTKQYSDEDLWIENINYFEDKLNIFNKI